jgi:hypothetical protein
MGDGMSSVGRRHIGVRVLSLFLACVMWSPLPEAQAPSSSSTTGMVDQTIHDKFPTTIAVTHPRLACFDHDLENTGLVRSQRNPQADLWGDVTVAQPKIWQFERVSALLDGLLRDVEGVSLGDLTQLDPSQQNGAALKFVQSALEVGVQYDQAAAVNAANTLSSYNSLHASQIEQLNQYNTYMETLTGERDRLAAQYSGASNEVNALSALKSAGPHNRRSTETA